MIKNIITVFAKIFMALLVSVTLIFAVGLVRLSQSPIQLRAGLIEKFIKIDNVKYGDVFLENPGLSALPSVSLYDCSLTHPQAYVYAKKVSAKINIWQLLYGKISVDTVLVDTPQVSVHYVLTGQNKPVAAVPESAFTLQTLIEKVRLPAKNIYIKNGRVTFYKHGKQVGKIHKADFYYTTHGGHSTADLNIKPSKKNSLIKVATVYNHGSQHFDFKVNVNDFLMQEKFLPYRLRPYLRLAPYLKKAPLTVSAKGSVGLKNMMPTGDIKAHLRFPLKDALGQENKIDIKARTQLSTQDQSLAFDSTIQAQEFDWSLLGTLWPKGLGESARAWVLENMQGGTAVPSTLNFAVGVDLNTLGVTITGIHGTVGVNNTTVSYLGDLPPVQNTSALAHFDATKFDIDITQGTVYGLEIPKAKVLLYDLNTESKADIHLKVVGPLNDALKLIDQPPLKLLSPYGLVPNDFKGDADISTRLKFPLKSGLNPSEVITTTDAQLKDVNFVYKVQGVPVDLTKGVLELSVDDNTLSLKGPCYINTYPGTIDWRESFKPSKDTPLQTFNMTLQAPFKDLAAFAPESVKVVVTNPDLMTVDGLTDATLEFTEHTKGHSTLNLGLDLSQNRMNLHPFHIIIPKAKGHQFAMRLEMQNNVPKFIEPLIFNTGPVSIQGSVAFDKTGALHRINLSHININTHNIKANGALRNNYLKMDIRAQEINLFPLIDSFKKETENHSSGPSYKLHSDIHAEIAKLGLKDGIMLSNVSVQSKYKQDILNTLKVTCMEGDKPIVDFYYGPRDDKMVFEFKSEAIENVLKGFDVSDNIKAALVYSHAEKPLSSDEKMVGTLKVKDLRVRNTPVLAKIFNLMSLESLLSTLTGQGILFVKGTADYEYKDGQLAIQKGDLTSSGIGLTTQGYIDFNNKLLDLHGVIIPANILNKAITGIPLIGTLLTAGKTESGLISTSYTVKGSTDDPKVNANPLSVLAPTLVRRIFSGVFGDAEKEISIQNFPDLEKDHEKS